MKNVALEILDASQERWSDEECEAKLKEGEQEYADLMQALDKIDAPFLCSILKPDGMLHFWSGDDEEIETMLSLIEANWA